MNMSNATAAGPPEGLLEMLFGSKGEADQKAEAGFTKLLEAIQGLGKKVEQGETSEANRWTTSETAPGKDDRESVVAGNPELAMMSVLQYKQALAEQARAEIPKSANRETAGDSTRVDSRAFSPMAMLMSNPIATKGPPESAQAVQEQAVNKILQAKGEAPLSVDEAKLLSEVNEKFNARAIEQHGKSELRNAGVTVDQAALAMLSAGKIQVANQEGEPLPQEQPSIRPKSSETVQSSTESFLSMRDAVKNVAETGGEAKLVRKLNSASSGAEVDKAQVLAMATPPVVSGEKEKSQTNNGEQQFSSQLGAAVIQMGDLKRSEIEFKDIYLNSANSLSEKTDTLMREVNQSVGFQAVRGGGEMRLVIHPEALGEIHLKVGTKNGVVSVKMTTQSQEVASIIKNGSDDLKASLKENQMELGSFEVSVASEAAYSVGETKIETKENSSQTMFDQRQSQNSQMQGQSQGDMGQNSRSDESFESWDGSSFSQPAKPAAKQAVRAESYGQTGEIPD